jgi:lysophospholipase L1-like esterase
LLILSACREPAAPPAADSLPYAAELRKYRQADSLHPPPPGMILFTGSSSFRRWDSLEQDFAPYPVLNRSFGGSTFDDLLQIAHQAVWPYRPSAVFVYQGDNDLTRPGVTPEIVMGRARRFADSMRLRLPGVPVVFLAPKLSPSRRHRQADYARLRDSLQAWAGPSPAADWADTYSPLLDAQGRCVPAYFTEDSLHLSRAGYLRWREALRPVVEQYAATR